MTMPARFLASCFLSLLLSSLLFNEAHADAPLPAPAKTVFNSNNNRVQLISDPALGSKVIDQKNKNKVLWTSPYWFRLAFISDDGEYAVTVYDGLNLIPEDYSDDLIMLSFWQRGKLLHKVRLKEIAPDKHLLRKTASHYAWGHFRGIDEENKFVLERTDGKLLYFDLRTGKMSGN
ncbi:hypothetical protein [Undibacterium sp.]|uniref:hypothetical protein n=1 Tax=Undibacterium sp. TaxID=1914977 RepID=UPI002731BF6E|nr:hypothetical protein [Undibacterium sp.]MDP1977261.1 hypothetical protein [Undibacterium sp.]